MNTPDFSRDLTSGGIEILFIPVVTVYIVFITVTLTTTPVASAAALLAPVAVLGWLNRHRARAAFGPHDILTEYTVRVCAAERAGPFQNFDPALRGVRNDCRRLADAVDGALVVETDIEQTKRITPSRRSEGEITLLVASESTVDREELRTHLEQAVGDDGRVDGLLGVDVESRSTPTTDLRADVEDDFRQDLYRRLGEEVDDHETDTAETERVSAHRR